MTNTGNYGNKALQSCKGISLIVYMLNGSRLEIDFGNSLLRGDDMEFDKEVVITFIPILYKGSLSGL